MRGSEVGAARPSVAASLRPRGVRRLQRMRRSRARVPSSQRFLAAAESTTHYVTIFTGAKRIMAAIMKLDCSFLDPVMSPLPSVTVS